MKLTPSSRPQLGETRVKGILSSAKISDKVSLLGIRGYYSHTFAPAGNNRAVYDDAIFLVAPEFYASFNANTDPSAFKEGIASLQCGLWKYKLGIHGHSKPVAQRYTALIQAAPVTVMRDQQGLDTGYFGINIHRGGYNGTSSLGCQTIIPSQWDGFISSVRDRLKRADQKVIPYLLINEEDI